MIAVYVPPFKSPMTLAEAARALQAALASGRTEAVRNDVLALALAKSALETGRWRSMWNWNWGNVKAGESYAGMFTCISLNEWLVRNGKPRLVWFAPPGELVAGPDSALAHPALSVPPGHAQTRMRAYANRYDGAHAYVDALVTHFPRSYQVLWGADPNAFVRMLKNERYFTAAEGPYATAVASLQREFLKALRSGDIDSYESGEELEWDDLRSRVRAQQFDPLDLARDATDRNDEETLT